MTKSRKQEAYKARNWGWFGDDSERVQFHGCGEFLTKHEAVYLVRSGPSTFPEPHLRVARGNGPIRWLV